MKTILKTAILITCLSLIVIYSKSIQTELIDSYNNGIAFLSSNSKTKVNILRF
ncbi:hypothetical protein [Psychroserpens mesophilus]|uniref:hypothetical protein n=1 Tax=Psychroserpens mesophilus TaxID=325473 RepID=UPI003D656EF6